MPTFEILHPFIYMNRKQSLKSLALLAAAPSLIQNIALSQSNKKPLTNSPNFTAYLMAFFKENDQKLYYAYSRNAADRTSLNGRKFVLVAHSDLGSLKNLRKFRWVHRGEANIAVLFRLLRGN